MLPGGRQLCTGEKKERKKAVKKDHAFIDFTVVPE